MIEIWKHTIDPLLISLTGNPQAQLELPKGAAVLHFGNQRERMCIWEAHEPATEGTERRTFELIGTGNQVDTDVERYIGTAMFHNGDLVLHLFEVT
jgi:hypothetical protein